MSSQQDKIEAVPTNIITGFLGVGKTTAILNLMKAKPAGERWAVLVNEFGEIGVDGSLVKGQSSGEQQVFVREVPGGCMCCTAGVPMQIALNQLLTEAKPDRLLIEPTGLGHPKEVLEVLSSEHYRSVLSLQKNITLVDARNLSDSRYTSHDTFNQQIAIADTVIGNKTDLYQQGDEQALRDYVARVSRPETKVLFAEQGVIPLEEFNGASEGASYAPHHHHHHHHSEKVMASEQEIPECGYVKATNKGEGYHSVGWRFAPTKVFDRRKVVQLLVGLKAERMKAVFITSDGVFGYNLTKDGLTEAELDDCLESRIEVIAEDIDPALESNLVTCLEL
ncbi:GTP-binding protein [Vibrio sp. SCSIO 43136]|uniref:CobW family GTP-binding protein n=1 Tax=Vibrio sp. SCSIO 43136 TaxID=2819101 RepID=UPI0020755171|nr:GTP-binding protein [Vibrio sp. SCSIO 43136]USD67892.1 GTP-binding protein [Vibrio sp. SCSIO 43136]